MKPEFLNQNTRYGRALFAIEDGYFSMTTRALGSRREARCRLKDLDPTFHRVRRRFVLSALRGIATTAGIALFIHTAISQLRFIDDYLEVPVFRLYLYYIAAIFIVPMLFYSSTGFMTADFVEVFSRDRTFCVRIFRSKKQTKDVEEFLRKLLEAMEVCLRETEPNKTSEGNRQGKK